MMKSQLYCHFDNANIGVHQVYWLDGAKISNAMTKAYGFEGWREHFVNEKGEPSEVHIPQNMRDFNMYWQRVCDELVANLPAGQQVYIDLEHIPYVISGKKVDYAYLNMLAYTFKLKVPGARFAFDGVHTGLNIGDVLSDRVKLNPLKYGDFIEFIDTIVLGVYLLGKTSFARDLNYIAEMRRIVVRAYPKKKIMFSVWGRYHDSWNKTVEQYTIQEKDLLSYAKAVTRYGDDVIIFEPTLPRDSFLIEQLKSRSEPI